MTTRKKPYGKEYQDMVTEYKATDHQGKLSLAKRYGVTMDVLKHFISDGDTPPKEVESIAPKMTVCVEELLGMRPAVNLDFVCFDLETSGFDADWDILLTACIKPFGQEPITFRADDYPEWESDRANDKKITVAVATELRKHAIVVGHYSEKFDTMFLRAKMLRHGVEPLPPMFAIDTWRIALKNFKVSTRRQRSLSVFAQLKPQKDEPEGDRWMRASFSGDREAMTKILEHNKIDVMELEKLAAISFPYLKSIPRL